MLITDIFGKSPAVEKLCLNLQDNALDKIKIIDPYKGQFIEFTDEKRAYQHFTDSGGVESFAKTLLETLTKEQKPIRVIAFSVGASALWTLSENKQLAHIKQATCFYGSQIRYYQNVKPLFPIQLIFPDHELHFDVDELQKNLAQKTHVTTIKTAYLHGFMNKLSTNFDIDAYAEYSKLIAAT